MSERTDERTSDEADVDDLLDGGDTDTDVGGNLDGDVGSGTDDDVGLSDDDDLGVDVDALTSGPGSGGGGSDSSSGSSTAESTESADSKTDSGPGFLSRLTPSFSRPSLSPDVPSARSFLLAFVLVIGGMLLGSGVPFIGSLTALGGLFGGAFLLGLVSGNRRYFPVAVAGAAAAVGATAMQGVLTLTFIQSIGAAPTAALGATTGILIAVLGHYFGRDLRSGFTRDV